jgi:Flp pilus assembly pilin Flp
MKALIQSIKSFIRNEEGGETVEWLIVAGVLVLVSAGVIAAAVNPAIVDIWTAIGVQLNAVIP